MIISNSTLYSDVAVALLYVAPEEQKRVQDLAARAVFGADGYYGLTLGQFGQLSQTNDVSCIIPAIGTKTLTACEYLAAKGIPEFIKTYVDTLVKFSLQPTAKERAANAGCYKVDAIEGLLVFARSYFGLHSFKEAESVTLGDLLIAKKDSYNNQLRQRNYAAQSMRDIKKK